MKNNINEVWVFIEQRSGKAADVSFELLSKGKKLADSLKGILKAVVIGHNMKNAAEETFRFGAKEVLLIDHPELENYNTLPYSRIMSELVDKYQPRIVLFGATFIGRDLAPRVASHTRSGLTADCTDLQIADVTDPKTIIKTCFCKSVRLLAVILSPLLSVLTAMCKWRLFVKA